MCSLALCDLIFEALTLPKIIAKYWFGDGSLSFPACFFQMLFVHSLWSLDSFIFLIIAADRFVAICALLHNCSIINNKLISISCLVSWLACGIIGLTIIFMGTQLPYCASNRIQNWFCALMLVTLLACVDSLPDVSSVVHVVLLSFIKFSYAIIIRKIFLMAPLHSLQNLYYTCTTHWFFISLYFIPRLTVYTYNQVQLFSNANLNVLLIFLCSLVLHFPSPVIFCLRTEKIKSTLRLIFNKEISSKVIRRL